MDQKIKLLCIGDDVRHHSGMGLQLKKLMKGLVATGRFDVAEIACSNVPYSPEVVEFEGIRLYPERDYGKMDSFRRIMATENPQVVLALGDPRQYTQLFMMDNEIRPRARFILWHVWDNDPFPKFNAPLYAACDRIVTFSNFSHKLLRDGGVENDCIPCSVDPAEFHPLSAEVRESGRAELFATAKRPINFLVFWNSRNGARKRLPDMISAFKKFWRTRPDSMLFLNTDGRDREGTDIIQVAEDVDVCEAPIIFNLRRMPAEQLNVMYNLADVTASISYWEGFGLSIAESLAAGTPVIANLTGGMTEQVMTPGGPAGIPLNPVARNLHGTLEVPYIYMDFVSEDQIINALDQMYRATQDGYARGFGERGRQHMLDNFSVAGMVDKFDKLITEEAAKPITYENWRVLTI